MRIGMIGLGKIGSALADTLLAAGHEVIGYRRSSMEDFVARGGTAGRSPANVTEQSDIVLSCMPDTTALAAIMDGPDGVLSRARTGQVLVEFGSHPVEEKALYLARMRERGAHFLDGEVSGTPGMVRDRSAMLYLAGEEPAVESIRPVLDDLATEWAYLGAFGAATRTKLVNNLLVALHVAGTAQAMALGIGMGLDPAKLIPCVAGGSGGSVQFGIRAPWMAERRFSPLVGPAAGLLRYLQEARAEAVAAGVGARLIDDLIPLFTEAAAQADGRDVAAMMELFEPETTETGAETAPVPAQAL